MPGKASSLVAQAKVWASHYGKFTLGEEGAVLSVPLRIRGAWENQDADAFADVFVENGSMLVGDQQLKSREEIREYMRAALAGPYKGARLTEEPLEIKLLTPTVAIAVTQGGLIPGGETELSPEAEVRALWVIVKQDGDWQLASHQTSPIKS